MSGFKAIIALSFATVIGLTFMVLACALYESWWPLFVILFYLLSPIPIGIAKGCNDSHGSTSPELEFAIFATSGIVLSAFALPVLLAHAGIIKVGASVFSIIGSFAIFGTIYAYFYAHREDNFGTSII